MATIADLEEIIGPSPSTPPTVDWSELERISGLRFPADYRAYAARYPELEFDEFLLVFHPGYLSNPDDFFSDEPQLDNLRRMAEFGQITLLGDDGSESEVSPFPIYPEPHGLLVWGNTQNGNYCMWLTDDDPEKWTIVITDLLGYWHFNGRSWVL